MILEDWIDVCINKYSQIGVYEWVVIENVR